MGKKVEGQKLIVREATPAEKDWLYDNKELFSEPYKLIEERRRPEHKCFILLKGREIIGYQAFELGRMGLMGLLGTTKYVSSRGTSLRKGYEGRKLGRFLVGRVREWINANGIEYGILAAKKPLAKRFWAKVGFERSNGVQMHEKDVTIFGINFKKSKTPPRKTSWPRALGRRRH